MSALSELKKLLQEAKNHKAEPVVEEIVEISEEVEIEEEKVIGEKEVKALTELKSLLGELQQAKNKLEETQEEIIENVTPEEVSLVAKAAAYLNSAKKEPVSEAVMKDPATPLNQNFVTFRELNDHYNLLINRIQQQMASIGGGGEVWLRNLNDVDRSTLTPSNDNWVLEWDAASKKAKFTNQIGPLDLIYFDRTHTHEEVRLPGTLCWSPEDQTLNIEHPGGVTQQVGQESYAYVRNGTANTIPDGTPVMFSGAEEGGLSGARLLVSPIVADGTFPSLYGLGIATQNLEPGQDGRVTVWGKVREINTNAWNVGDILFADPANPGQLTNVKPTAPNNVIPFAAVLKKGITDGEIFVRPTIEQMMYYGRFSRLSDFTVANQNQAYAIPFDTVDISNGIVFNGGTGTQISVPSSGFYQFDVSAQITATSNKGIVYIWFRKNGTNIPNSTRSTTVTNGDTFNISTSIQISLNTNDYIEVMFARTATGIFLDYRTATAFAPTTSAITVNVTQIQL